MKNLFTLLLAIVFQCTVFIMSAAAQCSGTVAIVGGGCEGAKLYANTIGGNAVQQLIWKCRSRNNEVVYTSDATAYYADGITVAGGNGAGSAANQLYQPVGIAKDKAGNIYIADFSNNRVQKWVPGATTGITVAGGNGYGSAANQLAHPYDVKVDDKGDIYISDYNNNRVQKWVPDAKEGITVAGGNGGGSGAEQLYAPDGIFLDNNNNIYIADNGNNRVQKWVPGASKGITVAGGNGFGTADNQLGSAEGIYIDSEGNIYISDSYNNRVQKWAFGEAKGITVAGGHGKGKASNQLDYPKGVFLDAFNNLYIADAANNRVQKWLIGADTGVTVAGGNIVGGIGSDQLNRPNAVYVASIDSLYVTDFNNNRVQLFTGSVGSNINNMYQPTDGGVYTVTAVYQGGCTVTSEGHHIKNLPKFINIEGQKRNLCTGGVFTYIVKAQPGTTNITWAAPAGCTIVSGQGTATIQLNIPPGAFNEEFLTVTGENRCGTGPAFTDTLSTKPDRPGAIQGPAQVHLYETVTYSVTPVAGNSYRWQVPAAVQILSGQNTPSITVIWGEAFPANVVVKTSACNAEAASGLRVSIVAATAIGANTIADNAAATNSSQAIKVYPNPAQNTATVLFTTAMAGSYILQVTDVAGKQLFVQKGIAATGENKVTINLTRYSKGAYFINITAADGKKLVSAVTKQ